MTIGFGMIAKRIEILVSLALLWMVGPIAWGQSPEIPVSASIPRKLADGVLKIIPPEVLPLESRVGPTDLPFVGNNPEIAWKAPEFPNDAPYFSSPTQTLEALGRDVLLRHPIWCLEFAFKPVRTITLDVPVKVPGTGGEGPKYANQRKVVYYMVYRVRYLGNDIDVQTQSYDQTVTVPTAVELSRHDAVRFIPRFVLSGNISDPANPGKYHVVDLDDTVIPVAKPAIAARERVGKPLFDSVEMSLQSIGFSSAENNQERWGVATWMDIDPRIDYFSVQVRGLTNAYKLVKVDGKEQILRKTLQLHFWRPGDAINPAEDPIHFGLPTFENSARMKRVLDQFKLEERLDYLWVYR